MATYYDGLNDFHKLIEVKRPTSSAQLVGLTLLHLNNKSGNSGTVKISDRELMFRTRLSKQTVTDAKRYLKNIGWLDFSIDKQKVTTYTLTFFSDKVGHEVGHELGHQLGHSRLVPYTPDSSKRKEEQTADAGVCEGDVAGATKPQVSNTRTLPLSSPTSSDVDANRIHEEWVKALGKSLQGNQALELETLASKDYARAQVAIARVKANKATNPFAYFKAVYSKLTPEEVAAQTPKPKTTNAANAARIANMFSDIAAQMALTGQRRD